ncbi:hypothetical protein ACFDR8_002837 [Arthrobacter sp. MP_2.3]
MRKVVLMMQVSLDGFIERPKRDLAGIGWMMSCIGTSTASSGAWALSWTGASCMS